jgi:hypothetical protein
VAGPGRGPPPGAGHRAVLARNGLVEGHCRTVYPDFSRSSITASCVSV